MTLERAMRKLSKADRARLDWCFEAGKPDFVRSEEGLFVGVHLDRVPHLELVERDGAWALAKKKLLDY